jgi:endonuclease/exonuclease/phosphatase family metal-dependent hydrolase
LTFQVFDEVVSNLERDLKKISALHPDIPIILAGDFNQSLVSKHYYGSNAKRERLKQFFTSNDLLALTSGDDDPVFRDSYPNACIDHICISDGSGFKLSSTSRWPNAPTLKDGPSDHYQIKVRLTHEI